MGCITTFIQSFLHAKLNDTEQYNTGIRIIFVVPKH